jgi:bifunctional DNA-binding transcriptional regulator/antitoxin component of YhaV-PrlF toxin-antitoxin module
MTHRVGRKSQVVIPKAFRKAARIEPTLMGRLASHRLVKALEKDHKAERRR